MNDFEKLKFEYERRTAATGLAGLLIRKGFAKDEATAERLLIAASVFLLLCAVLIGMYARPTRVPITTFTLQPGESVGSSQGLPAAVR